MSIQLGKWLVPNRVIYTYADAGIPTLPVWEAHNARMHDLLANGERPVHIILEQHPDYKPTSIDMGFAVRSLTFFAHPSIQYTISVSPSVHELNFRSAMIAELYDVKRFHTTTITEAINLLKQLDNSVDWESADTSILRSKYNDEDVT